MGPHQTSVSMRRGQVCLLEIRLVDPWKGPPCASRATGAGGVAPSRRGRK